MYKYYEYGTIEYYDQELTKAINNLRMAAKGFATINKDDTPIGKIDEYADTLHDAASSYEIALKNWAEHTNDGGNDNGKA